MRFDVVIIGSGVAGLATALFLSEISPQLKILIASKNSPYQTNSAYAQGGLAAVFDTKTDSFPLHYFDTMQAGCGYSKPTITRYFVKNAPIAVNWLKKNNVVFDVDNTGKFLLGLEGGHSANRIVHAKDETGIALINALYLKAKRLKNIQFSHNLFVYRLLKDSKNTIGGLLAFHTQTHQPLKIFSNKIVLATGGSGQVFNHTTNPLCATADGIALAKQVGAKISNMHQVQFHPTALLEPNVSQLFLISEAVRGFGAHIVDLNNYRFLFDYDTRGELATRNIVSEAMINHQKKFKRHALFINLKHIPKDSFHYRFPKISAYFVKQKFDISTQLIPVIPAAHYQNGGINVTRYGQTSITGLYAIGECANTQLHGNNRLASNSLVEAIVFAPLLAKHIVNTNVKSQKLLNDTYEPVLTQLPKNIEKSRLLVQQIMGNYISIKQQPNELKQAFKTLKTIENELFLPNHNLVLHTAFFEIKNLLTTAKLIIKSAINASNNIHLKKEIKYETYTTLG